MRQLFSYNYNNYMYKICSIKTCVNIFLVFEIKLFKISIVFIKLVFITIRCIAIFRVAHSAINVAFNLLRNFFVMER